MAMDPLLQRAESYVGMPYIDGEFDCADLAARVQWEIFGRVIALPVHRRRPMGARGQAREIHKLQAELAVRIDLPTTGCGVLMYELDRDGTQLWHIGTGFVDRQHVWVLHNSHALGSAYLQLLVDMQRQGMHVEGYYQWMTA